ncbi:hypothetical protein [Actinokineospora sp. NBRC 105648]|uniref:hypothetical protein n=1 Tax=Actinokineospora sp. NBRC 105648 TaxID=3032206 RepID=UPI0024A415CA|nr:hypothetical protein [Actinokineospora sp. NBRC 105648]GLZ43632.1 hypothetical protein Acsp05_72560 [Actinokineospora sp. NBRC 105648]
MAYRDARPGHGGDAFGKRVSGATGSEAGPRPVQLKGRATVLCVCPWPTETRFFDTVEVGRKAAIGARYMTAETVVTATLRALDRDCGYLAPGLANAPRRPRKLVAPIAADLPRRTCQMMPPFRKTQNNEFVRRLFRDTIARLSAVVGDCSTHSDRR